MKTILEYAVNIDAPNLCEKALSGKEALSLLKWNIEQNQKKHSKRMSNYTLIFMDCNMPFMDGYETSLKIRQLFYDHDIE